jgi:hypothetical protein
MKDRTVLKIFESLFLVGSGFIPKSHIMQMCCNNNRKEKEEEEHGEEDDVRQTENRGIKTETIIIMRYLLVP